MVASAIAFESIRVGAIGLFALSGYVITSEDELNFPPPDIIKLPAKSEMPTTHRILGRPARSIESMGRENRKKFSEG